MKRSINNLNKPKQGIALIVVLGFLAILTIMAVSFAINMRTERVSASMYLDSVRARQFIDVGLTRALDDLDVYMDSGALKDPDFEYHPSAGGAGAASNLISARVQTYLPSGMGVAPDTQYTAIYDGPTVSTNIIGRFAYQIINLGGFLDMNFVGTSLDRNAGRDPGEITISDSVLTDLDQNSWGSFRANLLSKWRRIETIAEFNELFSAGLKTGGSKNFLPISRCLPELDPDGNPKIYIGGDRDELLSEKNEIVPTLKDKCDIPAAEVDTVFSNIIDFVDNDRIPENPDSYSSEPVPMINEIVVSGNFSKQLLGAPAPPNSYRFVLKDFKITVEYWHPYPEKSGSSESFIITNAMFSISTADPTLPPPVGILFESLNPTNGAVATVTPQNISVNSRGYYSAEFTYPTKQVDVNGSGYASVGAMNTKVDVLSIAVQYGDAIVDRVVSPAQLQLPFQNGTIRKGIECLDPRLNHMSSSWSVEGNPDPALGMNKKTRVYTGGEPIGSDPVMYSRGFPLATNKPDVGVGSIADLGYISVGKPWETIALYEAAAGGKPNAINPVLDYFTIVPTGTVRYGYVNLNSKNREVLSAVFYDMPVNTAPENEPALLTFDAQNGLAFKYADYIQEQTLVTPFDRLSSIGLISKAYDSSFDNALDSDPAIESLIRNSIGLFTLRQNIFAIVVEAQALSETGVVMGQEKALAFVWRDPETVNGVNETIVRFFTFITD